MGPEPETTENAVRVTGALFHLLHAPGVTVTLPDDDGPGNQLDVSWDVLPGVYRITVEEIK